MNFHKKKKNQEAFGCYLFIEKAYECVLDGVVLVVWIRNCQIVPGSKVWAPSYVVHSDTLYLHTEVIRKLDYPVSELLRYTPIPYGNTLRLICSLTFLFRFRASSWLCFNSRESFVSGFLKWNSWDSNAWKKKGKNNWASRVLYGERNFSSSFYTWRVPKGAYILGIPRI